MIQSKKKIKEVKVKAIIEIKKTTIDHQIKQTIVEIKYIIEIGVEVEVKIRKTKEIIEIIEITKIKEVIKNIEIKVKVIVERIKIINTITIKIRIEIIDNKDRVV